MKGLLQGQAERRDSCAQKTQTPLWLSREVFIGNIWEEGYGHVTDLCLVGRWQGAVPGISGSSSSFQPVWGPVLGISPKLPSSPWGERSFCRRTHCQIVVYSFAEEPGPSPGCTYISWLPFLCFCIPSLPYLVTVWIYPSELRDGLGGWNLFFLWKSNGIQGKCFVCWRTPQRPAQRHLLRPCCTPFQKLLTSFHHVIEARDLRVILPFEKSYCDNLHIIQLLLLKGAILWLSVYSQLHDPSHSQFLNIFLTLEEPSRCHSSHFHLPTSPSHT